MFFFHQPKKTLLSGSFFGLANTPMVVFFDGLQGAGENLEHVGKIDGYARYLKEDFGTLPETNG